jgi:hypothetical protein
VNGEDLKFLAERSWAVEDRTPERVLEVRNRIAAASRRRTTATLATTTAVLVLLVLGIAVATHQRGGAKPDPAPIPVPVPSHNALAHSPEEGTCWDVPSASVVDAGNWKDTSAKVPCTRKHTTETAAVLVLDEPTVKAAQARGDMCWEYVRQYLGIDLQYWIPWQVVAFLPTQAQIDDGASWIRCDLAFPATGNSADVRATTRSGKGLAVNPPPDYWGCFNTLPTENRDQPYVPCSKTHVYESTGTLAMVSAPDEYPSASERADTAQEECRAAVPTRFRDVAVVGLWDYQSSFTPGLDVAAVCFVHNPDLTPLPAR